MPPCSAPASLIKDRMEVDPNVRQVVSFLEKQIAR